VNIGTEYFKNYQNTQGTLNLDKDKEISLSNNNHPYKNYKTENFLSNDFNMVSIAELSKALMMLIFVIKAIPKEHIKLSNSVPIEARSWFMQLLLRSLAIMDRMKTCPLMLGLNPKTLN
jgi:hypothetical protein